jgi:hypothetical protein
LASTSGGASIIEFWVQPFGEGTLDMFYLFGTLVGSLKIGLMMHKGNSLIIELVMQNKSKDAIYFLLFWLSVVYALYTL